MNSTNGIATGWRAAPVTRLVAVLLLIQLAVLLAVLPAVLPAFLVGCGRTTPDEAARQRVLQHNLAAPALLPAATLDSLLSAEADLPAADRIGLWARRFLAAGTSEYRFGLAEGGYAREGMLVDDAHHDCVSLLYRSSELARSRDHRDAILIALATRFAGASLDSLVDAQGRVDYDHPEHLDYSLDMIRSGLWGRDATAQLSGAMVDSVGSARYPAGGFSFVPTAALRPAELHEGDIAWLVLSTTDPSARALRDEHGLVIGHIGLIITSEGRSWLVHAARSDLPGWYSGGRIVKVPVEVYLERVERFGGLIVTRF
jgi:hypothetical protein